MLVAQVTSGVQSAFATCALENCRTRELTCHFMRLGECATRACDWDVTSGVQLRFEIFRTREITCYLITRRSAKENAIGAILL